MLIGKISIWYTTDELDMLGNLIGKKVEEDKGFFEKVKKAYSENWNILLPYIKRENHLKNVDEFKLIYDTYVKWWSAMAITSDAARNSDSVKEELEVVRKSTERYSEEVDKLFMEFVDNYFPQYKDIRTVL